MGLLLKNEFTVAAPLDETWETLLDIGRVARCMPGVRLEPGNEDGVHRGTMKVKLGPLNVAYAGTAKLEDADADARVSTMRVSAKEARGQGTASATVTNRLVASGEGTKVMVETDLAITGRQAQFGRGFMQDVASSMLGEFAKRLEREVLAGGASPAGEAAAAGAPASSPVAAASAAPAGATTASPVEEVDALELGGLVDPALVKRAGAGAAVAILLSLLTWALTRGRSRKGFEVTLRYR